MVPARRHAAMLAAMLAALAAGLAGCAPFNDAVGALAGVDAVVALPVFGRSTGDLVYSAVSGRDCSVVRLEQGKTYCRPREAPPPPAPFCTRSLGRVDCWAYPWTLPDQPMPVGGTPGLTPEQDADRTARWPNL